MEQHDLKIWPEYMKSVRSGAKKFEIRKNDRNFKVGDVLALYEFDPIAQKYVVDAEDEICTPFMVQITYMVQGVFGLPSDVAVMSIEPVEPF